MKTPRKRKGRNQTMYVHVHHDVLTETPLDRKRSASRRALAAYVDRLEAESDSEQARAVSKPARAYAAYKRAWAAFVAAERARRAAAERAASRRADYKRAWAAFEREAYQAMNTTNAVKEREQ